MLSAGLIQDAALLRKTFSEDLHLLILIYYL